MLKSSEFRKGREESWRELEGLVERVERRGVRALLADELQQLPLLYRAALSSLSVARTIALDRNLLLYLENLALRAYLAVYGPRVSPGEGRRTVSSFTIAGGRARRALALSDRLPGAAGRHRRRLLADGQDEAWFSAFVPAGLGRRARAFVDGARIAARQGDLRAVARGRRGSFGVVRQLSVQPQHHGRHL